MRRARAPPPTTATAQVGPSAGRRRRSARPRPRPSSSRRTPSWKTTPPTPWVSSPPSAHSSPCTRSADAPPAHTRPCATNAIFPEQEPPTRRASARRNQKEWAEPQPQLGFAVATLAPVPAAFACRVRHVRPLATTAAALSLAESKRAKEQRAKSKGQRAKGKGARYKQQPTKQETMWCAWGATLDSGGRACVCKGGQGTRLEHLAHRG